MAFAGISKTTKVLRTFQFCKFSLSFVTGRSVRNVHCTPPLNILCCKYFCTEKKAKVGKLTNPDAPEQPKKRKPLTSPHVTLILPEDDIRSVTLEQAQKLANRRNLKLVKILDFDTKTEKPLYKLMTTLQFFEEDAKFKEWKKKEKVSDTKEDKLFTISTKTTEHDLYNKTQQIFKLLKKNYGVRIYISHDGNSPRADEIGNIIEEELREVSNKIHRVSNDRTLKLFFNPKMENQDKNEDKNITRAISHQQTHKVDK